MLLVGQAGFMPTGIKETAAYSQPTKSMHWLLEAFMVSVCTK